jgi:hypothetical protein
VATYAWGGLHVIEPTSSIGNLPVAVRDGRAAPVTCAACGCRLAEGVIPGSWYHFRPMAGRDAQGCLVSCSEQAHDRHGRALPVD